MERITPKKMTHWMRIYRCYRQSFPSAERKPFGVIRNMQRQGKTDVWYFGKDGRFAGFASTINSEKLILLDYFAVARSFRGQGLGTAALMQLQNVYGRQGLFVEIERVCPDASNPHQRQKRKDFYLRCGMQELDVQAEVFGVEMELLGSRCTMTDQRYRDFYRDHYGAWAAEHIRKIGEK